MKQYPSIPRDIIYTDVYLQPKYDGSNFRAEWNCKKGFYKFGSRHQLIDRSSKQMGEAIDLVINKYSESIKELFTANKWQDGILFFEYYGANSFAGQHLESDTKTVTLFDVNPYKRGILPPEQFYNIFGHLDVATCIYRGKLTQEIVEDIKNSNFPGMAFEGVVAKINSKVTSMFKIKSNAWLEKLKIFCKNDENLFQKLL